MKTDAQLLSILADYVLIPIIIWGVALHNGFSWIDYLYKSKINLLVGNFLGFTMILAASYKMGYLGYYKSGRKNYFYIVFISPTIIGLVGLTIGFFK
ncbi:MAG TPA: hypothetical protein VF811_14400 [Parasulfuritortus sp.]